MKRGILFTLVVGFLFSLVFTPLGMTASEDCSLNVSLLNQDPYPVIPGDYVEVVFEVSGTDNSDCEGARFKINQEYPFSLDKGKQNLKEISGNTFVKDFKKTWMVPYKLRVDKDALDGMNTLEVKYTPGESSNVFYSKNFNIKVEDVRVDFEVSVKQYDTNTNTMTFEILNIGENDVEALTIDIPEQENLEIKGSPRNIVGSLDKNEETTFDFNLKSQKESIDLKITYTDEINERRSLNKTVYFNPEYFKHENNGGGEGLSFWFYLSIILIAYLIFRWYKQRRKKKRANNKK